MHKNYGKIDTEMLCLMRQNRHCLFYGPGQNLGRVMAMSLL